MKNSEEDILKRFLQDTFSDYEPEPSDLTWESIRKEIQPQQPNVGAGLRQWVMPVVALLLLIGGIVWNKKEPQNQTELAINSTKENSSSPNYQGENGSRSLKEQFPNVNKLFVNKAASKVESMVLAKVEKSMEVPTFSTIFSTVGKVSTEKYPSIKRKQPNLNSDSSDSEILGLNSGKKNQKSVNPVITNSGEKQSILNSNSSDSEILGLNSEDKNQKPVNPVNPNSDGKQSNLSSNLSDLRIVGLHSEDKNQKSVNSVYPNSDGVASDGIALKVTPDNPFAKIHKVINLINQTSINDAVIEEVRYIKPLEMLRNKGFVLIKNEVVIPQISQININQEVKPIRRPLYVSVGITPLQTYRILTVNSKDIQNLQTNKLFDSERNGFAFELGITKSIGQKWNLRSSVSYLKMRQWAEYQVNTEKISVKNSNNYSNAVSVGNNDNEFIGQTRVEAKTLQMVGLKADVQRFFKITGRNRYFISGGSQLMVEPIEKQTNIFINASAGFQHLVNKDCFLTIEPTASYLLNNINDSKSLIQTNAYNLGLKVGLNFKMR